MKNLYTAIRSGIFTGLLLSILPGQTQNLVVNPGAEGGDPSTNGWTAVSSGTSCSGGSGWRMPSGGGGGGYPNAATGGYFFNPGCGGAGSGAAYELQQDINVSANATAIDAHAYRVSFSGYTQSFNQTPVDEATITVEYRNATNTGVLGFYTTGTTTNTANWVRYTDVRLAPTGTRFIRVRLLAVSRNGNAIDSYFDDISVVGISVLPVNLLSFTAAARNGHVNLQWKTANEVNTKGFSVLRSADGVSWMDIGFVKAAAGTQTVNDYFFSDNAPLAGTGFYRLQQTDLGGGGSTLSKVVTVNPEKAAVVVLYPNPAKDNLFFKSPQPVLSIEIMDNLGRVMERHTGVNVVPVQHLRSGSYVAKVSGNGFTEYKPFVKE